MGVAVAYNPCRWCPYKDSGERCGMCELTVSRKGWISVKDRKPEERLKAYFCSDGSVVGGARSIPSGSVVTGESTASHPVIICSNSPDGAYITLDRTIGGQWVNNWYVTHWMPLPDFPKELRTEGDGDV